MALGVLFPRSNIIRKRKIRVEKFFERKWRRGKFLTFELFKINFNATFILMVLDVLFPRSNTKMQNLYL